MKYRFVKNIFIIILITKISNYAIAQVDSSFYTVHLSSFDASINRKATTLHWKTVCFFQFANFQIQKSIDGTDYFTIGSFTVDRLWCQQPFYFRSNEYQRFRVKQMGLAFSLQK